VLKKYRAYSNLKKVVVALVSRPQNNHSRILETSFMTRPLHLSSYSLTSDSK
jgi:hypothetical protein